MWAYNYRMFRQLILVINFLIKEMFNYEYLDYA